MTDALDTRLNGEQAAENLNMAREAAAKIADARGYMIHGDEYRAGQMDDHDMVQVAVEAVASARLSDRERIGELEAVLREMITAFGAATAGDIAARDWLESACQSARAALGGAKP